MYYSSESESTSYDNSFCECESYSSNSYCSLCDCPVPNKNICWEQHISGRRHISLLYPPYQKLAFSYLKEGHYIEEYDSRRFCKVCHVWVPPGEYNWITHVNGNGHQCVLNLVARDGQYIQYGTNLYPGIYYCRLCKYHMKSIDNVISHCHNEHDY